MPPPELRVPLAVPLLLTILVTAAAAEDKAVETLRREVATKGWVVTSIKQKRGDWDLVLMRPDGSQQRKLTDTPDWSVVLDIDALAAELHNKDGSVVKIR